MEKGQRMERNRKYKLRITEIPPEDGEYEKIECPYCHKTLPVGLSAHGTCSGITTVCKFCKRKLTISAEEREAQRQQSGNKYIT